MVLKPLIDEFGARKAIVTTMQALSGAGFPGVPSLSIQENVIPYIKNEEEKVAAEAKKILGTYANGAIKPSPITMGISCNRVAVIDGHMETLYAEFAEDDHSEGGREVSREVQRASRRGSSSPPPRTSRS